MSPQIIYETFSLCTKLEGDSFLSLVSYMLQKSSVTTLALRAQQQLTVVKHLKA